MGKFGKLILVPEEVSSLGQQVSQLYLKTREINLIPRREAYRRLYEIWDMPPVKIRERVKCIEGELGNPALIVWRHYNSTGAGFEDLEKHMREYAILISMRPSTIRRVNGLMSRVRDFSLSSNSNVFPIGTSRNS